MSLYKVLLSLHTVFVSEKKKKHLMDLTQWKTYTSSVNIFTFSVYRAFSPFLDLGRSPKGIEEQG